MPLLSLRAFVACKKGENYLTPYHFNLQEPSVLYIGRTGRTQHYPPNTPFYIFIQQISVLNFLNMLHILRFFFSSKCRLFHNATFFGSCIIRILHTGCAKIKIPNYGARRLTKFYECKHFQHYDVAAPST
jgi:hypothetical protein